MRYAIFLTIVILGGWLAISAAGPPSPDYKRDIAPLLEAKCLRCHSPKKSDGKLDLTTRTAMLKGGISGPAIEPGKPDKSLIIELVHFNEMPPKRVQPRVTPDELTLLKAWITAGAPDK